MEETTLFGRLPQEYSHNVTQSSQLKKVPQLELIVHFFMLLFIYAALRKLTDLEMFVKEVWGFAIFGSKQMVRTGFIVLSCAELTVGIMLAIQKTRQYGIYGAFLLMAAINVLFFIIQQYAKVIPLYYGGILPSVNFITHFIFNIALLFIALRAIFLHMQMRTSK